MFKKFQLLYAYKLYAHKKGVLSKRNALKKIFVVVVVYNSYSYFISKKYNKEKLRIRTKDYRPLFPTKCHEQWWT